MYNSKWCLSHYELSTEQWEKIKSYFESKRGRPKKNLRNTVNGIVWILRSDASWRDLPSRYGNWNADFSKWQAQGLFETIFKDLTSECDLQDVSIDSTTVKVHKEIMIGRSRGGDTTKIHAILDALGTPINIIYLQQDRYMT